MRKVSTLLLVVGLLEAVGAIVCPPQPALAAKAQQQEGDACGGTCNSHGTCAAGLACRQPPKAVAGSRQSLMLGMTAAGTCTREDPSGGSPTAPLGGTVDMESEIVVAGVQQMNNWVNSMYLIVPVSTESFEQKNDEHGVGYSINVNTQTSSACRNDGEHKVDDHACPPDSDAKLQLYHLEVADQGENSKVRFMLMDGGPAALE